MISESSSNQDGTALVLISGGIDSTACADFYLSQGFSVRALFVQYGQLAVQKEGEASQQVCDHYRVPLTVVSCEGLMEKTGGVIRGRNAFLLFTALMEFNAQSGVIAAGIHAGTSYTDCSKRFLASIQVIFDDYTDGRIRVCAPFLDWSKQDIWEYCIDRRVPLDLTYSCELGKNQPCSECLSCRDLESLRALPKLNA